MCNASPCRTRPAVAQSGFGLIEILVAMAIGLIGMLAIMQAFAMNERYKENTVGASGAQANGSIALFTVERDIRMSGYGLTHAPVLGCGPLQYFFNGQYSGGGALPPLLLVPVLIEQGAAGASDTITTLSSNNDYRLTLATLNQDMPSASADIRATNGVGLAVGDLAVAIQGVNCSLMQITNVPDPATHYQRAPNGIYNPPGGGALPAFTVGAQILSLGRPQLRRYALVNNNLTVQDWDMLLTGTAPTVIVDEIFNLQAEYGLDDGGGGGVANDNVIDTYTPVTPVGAVAWQQLQAIRIGVLARGSFERPDANGNCTAITAANMPTWSGGAFNIPDVDQNRCYRYRVFETIVPVRNMIWRSDR